MERFRSSYDTKETQFHVLIFQRATASGFVQYQDETHCKRTVYARRRMC